MPLETAVLVLHAATSIAMAGLIWFVQVVHYPLMAMVAPHGFAAYELEHQRRTTLIVAPLMLCEAAAAACLPFLAPSVPAWAAGVGGGLLLTAWVSTFALQVPSHAALERGFDPRHHARLVRTNWIRTTAWTARAALSLALLIPA